MLFLDPRLGDPALRDEKKQEPLLRETDLFLMSDARSSTTAKSMLRVLGKALPSVEGGLFPSRPLTSIRLLYNLKEFQAGGHLALRNQRALTARSADPLETLYVLQPKKFKLKKVDGPLRGSSLKFDSNYARAWTDIAVKTETEAQYTWVTHETCMAIFGIGSGDECKGGKGGGDDSKGDAEVTNDNDDAVLLQSDAEAVSGDEAAQPETEEPAVKTKRHLFPWSAPEELYRNIYHAFMMTDTAANQCTVYDFLAGSGHGALAAARDGRGYVGFCLSAHRLIWNSFCGAECYLCVCASKLPRSRLRVSAWGVMFTRSCGYQGQASLLDPEAPVGPDRCGAHLGKSRLAQEEGPQQSQFLDRRK